MGKMMYRLRRIQPTDNQLEATRNLVRDLIASGTLFALLSTGARSCIPATSFADYVFLTLFFICFMFVLTWSSLIADLNLRQITGSDASNYRVPYFILAICFTVVFFWTDFFTSQKLLVSSWYYLISKPSRWGTSWHRSAPGTGCTSADNRALKVS